MATSRKFNVLVNGDQRLIEKVKIEKQITDDIKLYHTLQKPIDEYYKEFYEKFN